jgi:putative hydrolase of the HAD superfamily
MPPILGPRAAGEHREQPGPYPEVCPARRFTVVQLRGVLLDLDDTLLDQRGAVREAFFAWLPTLGVTPTPELHQLWVDLQEHHLAAWRERRVTFGEQRRRRLRDFLPAAGIPYAEAGTPYAEQDLDRVFAGYLARYEEAYTLFDDVPDTLAALRSAGVVTAVLTNGVAGQQNDKIARVGLAGRLGPVFTAEDLGVAKPDPSAFSSACSRWGLPPSSVLSVGDRHDLDVLPARAAGLRAVHLDRRDEGPHEERFRITSLAVLPSFIRDYS